jgi:hypothetical protein
VTFNTRNNNNLAIDYADPNYFASSNLDNAMVTVWDKRAGSRQVASNFSSLYQQNLDSGYLPFGCVLKALDTIDDTKGASIRSLRYCRDRRGLLGILSSAGQLEVLRTELERMEDDQIVAGSPEMLYIQRSFTLAFPIHDELFPHSQSEMIASFDWMSLNSDTLQPRVITRRYDAELELKLLPTGAKGAMFDLLNISSNHQSK